MTPSPWLGDAVSLVEAFRANKLTPLEALNESIAAIESSQLNAIAHLDVLIERVGYQPSEWENHQLATARA